MTEDEAVSVVQACLDTPTGNCYTASEAVYHLLGGKTSGYVPMQVWVGTVSHWYLRAPDGRYVDPTADQFEWYEGDISSYYPRGRGCGFLTSRPCARTRTLLDQVRRVTIQIT